VSTRIQIRIIIILGVLFLGFYSIYPTLSWYSKDELERENLIKLRDPIVDKILKLGLDLKGGMHLVLEIEESKIPEGTTVEDAVLRAIEIIRNRVDQFGVSEPLIARQGKKWIVVQLPGIKDPRSALEIIGKTALLEFKLVNEEKLKDAIEGKIPEGYELLESEEGEKFLVKKEPEITGSYLKDARVRIGGVYNMPYVSLEFNKEGAKIFSKVTSENINRRLAIILDGVVKSAPVIRTRIPDGRAIIEGNFTMDEARNLAIVLRAGALPAPVKVIENRTIGPTLGSDSIRKGVNAALIGGVLVIIFMIIRYKLGGILADFALILDLFLLVSFLALLKATLTLPGVAGIILTIGMAVDANVLIYERIKEELRAGKTVRSAIDSGYDKAFHTIMDANITTLIAAIFLFQFGTGPIKGFAVTLTLGIIVSMFTAIFVTKTIWEIILGRRKWERLPI